MSTWNRRHLLSLLDLSSKEIMELLSHARVIRDEPFSNRLEKKLIACCFFEPSTRTRLSFETITYRLGGQIIGFSEPGNTSTSKGESLSDTIKMVSQFADLIVLRHSRDGAAKWAGEISEKPLINAGDGANEHPTQTLTDLFTIWESQNRLEDLHIAFVGDLKYGRTVHSLVKASALFNMRLYFISPKQLSLPEELCDIMHQRGICYSFHEKIEEVIPKLDILYMTRIQKERFEKNEKVKQMTLSLHLLKKAKPTMRILHPLPRCSEIPPSIDSTDFALYFQQAKNGLYVRGALLDMILNNREVALENSFCYSH